MALSDEDVERIAERIGRGLIGTLTNKKEVERAGTKSPCPPSGPAHDGRGGGKGVPGGTRKGISSPRPASRPGTRSPNPRR